MDLLRDLFLPSHLHPSTGLSPEHLVALRTSSSYFSYLFELYQFTGASAERKLDEGQVQAGLHTLCHTLNLPLPYYQPILDQIVTLLRLSPFYLS